MMLYYDTILPVSAILIVVILNGQECLRSNSNNGVPPTQLYSGRYDVIPSGYQAIIISYRFQCYGNITYWEVATTRCSIDIELQVWRPSVRADNSGHLYNKISAIVLTAVSGATDYFPQQQIEVIPGDVLGFQVLNPAEFDHERETTGESNADEDQCDEYKDSTTSGTRIIPRNTRGHGIVLLNSINNTETNEEVWYALLNDKVVGPISVGSNGVLNTFTDAASVISVSVHSINTYTPSFPHYHPQTTTSIYGKSVTVTASPILRNMMNDEDSRMNTIMVVVTTTTAAILLTVVITTVAVLCIWFVIRRKTNTHTLTTASQGGAQDEGDTPFYRKDIVKTVRDREAMRIQLGQLTREIQQSAGQAIRQQVNPGSSEIGQSNSDANSSITMKNNEAYGKVIHSLTVVTMKMNITTSMIMPTRMPLYNYMYMYCMCNECIITACQQISLL